MHFRMMKQPSQKRRTYSQFGLTLLDILDPHVVHRRVSIFQDE